MISKKLSIQESTVRRHLATIRKTLGTRGSIEMLCLLDTEMSAETPMIRLTPRGKEVFQLIMKGLTIRQIGELLGISYSGVLRQREKMLLQNNCTSMLELLAKYRGKLDAGTNDPSC
ncbi:MAG: LuxR C-terminal-related transcriptional regulator [Deltaproteobacteria bacterium]|nr:LuxR C-terminal-related transcriptional regulator [Deltaproteobacteria bacterium]